MRNFEENESKRSDSLSQMDCFGRRGFGPLCWQSPAKIVRVWLGDGGFGYQEGAPYDRICITAVYDEVPATLLEQLRVGGKLIAPIEEQGVQNLTLLRKGEHGMSRQVICQVLYIPLRGQYGQVRASLAD